MGCIGLFWWIVDMERAGYEKHALADIRRIFIDQIIFGMYANN